MTRARFRYLFLCQVYCACFVTFSIFQLLQSRAMPLLNREPFVKVRPPPDIQKDDEVFYCKLTDEVFVDYDEFFERTILCNSLVWTCCLTGGSHKVWVQYL